MPPTAITEIKIYSGLLKQGDTVMECDHSQVYRLSASKSFKEVVSRKLFPPYYLSCFYGVQKQLNTFIYLEVWCYINYTKEFDDLPIKKFRTLFPLFIYNEPLKQKLEKNNKAKQVFQLKDSDLGSYSLVNKQKEFRLKTDITTDMSLNSGLFRLPLFNEMNCQTCNYCYMRVTDQTVKNIDKDASSYQLSDYPIPEYYNQSTLLQIYDFLQVYEVPEEEDPYRDQFLHISIMFITELTQEGQLTYQLAVTNAKGDAEPDMEQNLMISEGELWIYRTEGKKKFTEHRNIFLANNQAILQNDYFLVIQVSRQPDKGSQEELLGYVKHRIKNRSGQFRPGVVLSNLFKKQKGETLSTNMQLAIQFQFGPTAEQMFFPAKDPLRVRVVQVKNYRHRFPVTIDMALTSEKGFVKNLKTNKPFVFEMENRYVHPDASSKTVYLKSNCDVSFPVDLEELREHNRCRLHRFSVVISVNYIQNEQLVQLGWYGHPLFKDGIQPNTGIFEATLWKLPIKKGGPYDLKKQEKIDSKIQFEVIYPKITEGKPAMLQTEQTEQELV